MQHTPAPWRLWKAHTPEKPDEYPLPGEGDRRLVGADDICLGVLFGGFSTLPELERNHALIVAAPDMLAVLKVVHASGLSADLEPAVRAAIAKAELKE